MLRVSPPLTITVEQAENSLDLLYEIIARWQEEARCRNLRQRRFHIEAQGRERASLDASNVINAAGCIPVRPEDLRSFKSVRLVLELTWGTAISFTSLPRVRSLRSRPWALI